ncbi:hypothetical protein HDV06_007009 [Boothiomyces sp. JEL0866]|nr:hypothetical protein HDV06_007009 [Boothiomyces sp. JEL0866]
MKLAALLISVVLAGPIDKRDPIIRVTQPDAIHKRDPIIRVTQPDAVHKRDPIIRVTQPDAVHKRDPIIRKVSILRPLKGLDNNLYKNLRSSFIQDYQNYEIVFSVESESDPSYDLVLELQKEFPSKSRIVVGIENVGLNPKVNNLVKGYESSDADIIWILDSNVSIEPHATSRVVEILQDPTVGLVHHVPNMSTIASYLDGIFLTTTHARMYTAINSFKVASCIIGKSNIFRKCDLDSVGGLRAFGKYMSEDNIIGIKIMEKGFSHVISPDFCYQSIGPMTMTDFLKRRARWIRVRKYTVTLATLYEPFSEFTMDMLIVKRVYGKIKPKLVLCWFLRELLALPIYLWAIAGSGVEWRGTRFYLNSDGTVDLIKKKR